MKDKKILLVTGVSSDIGSLLVDKVAYQYDKILSHYRSSDEMVKKLQKKYGNKIVPLQADFTDLASTQHLIDEIKKTGFYPDHIVHLPAQRIRTLQFHKQTWDNYQAGIDISLRSIMMILQQLIPHMTKQKYGKIVFMLTASVIGMPPKFLSPYVTIKYALLGLMKTLNSEYASKGISVNAVSPEMVETKFLSELSDLVKEQNAKNSTIGRNLQAEEVVPAIQYLLSDSGDMISGQNIGITSGIR